MAKFNPTLTKEGDQWVLRGNAPTMGYFITSAGIVAEKIGLDDINDTLHGIYGPNRTQILAEGFAEAMGAGPSFMAN